MADQVTANFGFVKPTPSDPGGASTWGTKLNANFDSIDAALQTVANSVLLPNIMHNSGFFINQRNSQPGNVAASAYFYDRWKAGASGASYGTAANGADVALSVTAGSVLQIVHPAEVSGGTYTVSHEGTATVRMYQGSASGAYSASPVTASNVTAGTALVVEFTGGTIIRPQLVNSAAPKPYNRKSLATEIRDCLSFYEVMYISDSYANSDSTAHGVNFSKPFSPKVKAPTITSALTLGGSAQYYGVSVTGNSIVSSLQVNANATGFLSGNVFISSDL